MNETPGTTINISEFVKPGAFSIEYEDIQLTDEISASVKEWLSGKKDLSAEIEFAGTIDNYDIFKSQGDTVVNMSFNSPEFRYVMKRFSLALQLWVDWFEKRGSPKTYGAHGATCFFCDNAADTVGKIKHRPNCTYRQAKKLVNEIRTLKNE